jgi:hypothetical protein
MHRFILLSIGFLFTFQSSTFSQATVPSQEQMLRAVGKMENGQREGQWAF